MTTDKMASEFVYLEEVDPTILQEIRYAGYHNVLGRPIAGYEAARCVTTRVVAKALSQAQKQANDMGYTFKVYEAYRPLRAGEDWVKWTRNAEDQLMKDEFYSGIDKTKMFELGYVALRSQHTRGAAVDVTLVPIEVPRQDTYQAGDKLVCGTLPKGQRFNDNSIEMGTGFDCMHELSHTANPNISEEAKKNRKLLCDLMERHGFENYSKEWWHFGFKDETYPNQYFDFPIR